MKSIVIKKPACTAANNKWIILVSNQNAAHAMMTTEINQTINQ